MPALAMATAIAVAAMAMAMAAAAGLLSTTAPGLSLAAGVAMADAAAHTQHTALLMMAAATIMAANSVAMALIDIIAGTATSDFTGPLDVAAREPVRLDVVRAYSPANLEPDLSVFSADQTAGQSSALLDIVPARLAPTSARHSAVDASDKFVSAQAGSIGS